jgi:hypothetical protein
MTTAILTLLPIAIILLFINAYLNDKQLTPPHLRPVQRMDEPT